MIMNHENYDNKHVVLDNQYSQVQVRDICQKNCPPRVNSRFPVSEGTFYYISTVSNCYYATKVNTQTYLSNGLQVACRLQLVDPMALGLAIGSTLSYWTLAATTTYTDSEHYVTCKIP